MSTEVHRILGEKRIKEICSRYSLTPEDEKVIDEILGKWDNLIGQKKIEIALNSLRNNPHHQQIISALYTINIKFISKKKPES